jgi:FMN-dependent NADH-azoreductase
LRQLLRHRHEPPPHRHGPPNLRWALRFIGVSDVRFALIGPTAGPAEPTRLAREAAHRHLVELASSF